MAEDDVINLGAIATIWEPGAQTLSADPISTKFVADGSIAFLPDGRAFTMFKKPGTVVNTLFEIHWGPPITLTPLGTTPITDFKDGNCDLSVDPIKRELVAFNTCSPSPATGGDAVAVLWRTGITAPAASGGSDAALAARVATLEQLVIRLQQLLQQHETRLDKISAGAAG